MPPRALVLLSACMAPAAFADEKPLRYLPSDTRAVLDVRFTALDPRERAESRRLFDDLFRTHLAGELGHEGKFPISDIRRTVVAMPYAGSLHSVVVVQGKLDRKQLQDQMTRIARATGELSVERMGRPPVEVYSRRVNEKALLALVPPLAKVPPAFRRLVAPQEVHLAAMDDETLFVSLSGKRQVERALRARTATGLRVIPELAAVLRKQDGGDLASVVVMDDSLHPGLALAADEPTRETFGQFDHATLRIIAGKEMRFEIGVQSKSADVAPTLEMKARRALEVLERLLPTLFPDETKRGIMASLLESFRVSRKDERITLTGQLSQDDWKRLLAPKK